MKQVTEGVHTWSVFHEEKGYDFNGWYLDVGGTRLLVDPPELTDEVRASIEALGPPERIVLTNKDHRRAAPEAKAAFGIPIFIHAADAPLVDCEVDATFEDGDTLAPGLVAVQVRDNKSPGESALWWAKRRILVLGDALIGDPPGRLRLLPPGKYADVAKARAGIAPLAALDPDMVLVGDGVSLPAGGGDAIRRFLG